MNKRKLLTLAMTLCMVAILAIGGTLAYFTDTEKASNVFTIGNVDIKLEEKQYDHENKQWVDYVDDKHMVPMSNETGITQYNKAVNTTNISSSGEPVYIRTLIAVEDPDVGDDVGVYSMHTGFNTTNVTLADGTIRYGVDFEKLNDVTIDNRNFDVFVCTTLDGAAVAKDSFVQSLHSVWMDENISATDAAAYGAKVEVYVVSQAIQATDLDHAEAMAELGDVRTNASDWFEIGAAQ